MYPFTYWSPLLTDLYLFQGRAPGRKSRPSVALRLVLCTLYILACTFIRAALLAERVHLPLPYFFSLSVRFLFLTWNFFRAALLAERVHLPFAQLFLLSVSLLFLICTFSGPLRAKRIPTVGFRLFFSLLFSLLIYTVVRVAPPAKSWLTSPCSLHPFYSFSVPFLGLHRAKRISSRRGHGPDPWRHPRNRYQRLDRGKRYAVVWRYLLSRRVLVVPYLVHKLHTPLR